MNHVFTHLDESTMVGVFNGVSLEILVGRKKQPYIV